VQQRAAEAFGFNEHKWQKHDSENNFFKGTWAADVVDFNVLRPEHRDAAECLGFDELIWANEHRAVIMKMHFCDLPPLLQQAAEFLGYNAHKWDKDKEVKYDSYRWKKLPGEAKWAAKKLGYTAKEWDRESSECVR